MRRTAGTASRSSIPRPGGDRRVARPRASPRSASRPRTPARRRRPSCSRSSPASASASTPGRRASAACSRAWATPRSSPRTSRSRAPARPSGATIESPTAARRREPAVDVLAPDGRHLALSAGAPGARRRRRRRRRRHRVAAGRGVSRCARRARQPRRLPRRPADWPAWAAPAALGGAWALRSASPPCWSWSRFPAWTRRRPSSRSRCSRAPAPSALLVWLAGGTGECSAAPSSPPRAAARPRRALVACAGRRGARRRCCCLLLALARRLRRAPRPARADAARRRSPGCRAGEPAVPFDGAAVASLLARAVIAPWCSSSCCAASCCPRSRACSARGRPSPSPPWSAARPGARSRATAGCCCPRSLLGVLLGPLFVATGSIVPGTGRRGAASPARPSRCRAAGAPPGAVLAGARVPPRSSAGVAAGRRRPRRRAAPASARRRRARRAGRARRGQTAAEYDGRAADRRALIVGAVRHVGLGDRIARQIELLICRIAGGDCTRARDRGRQGLHGLASRSAPAAWRVTVAVVKVGEESTLIKQEFADGRTVFTLIKNGSVAAELIAGAKAKAGNVGFDATASVSAGGKLEGARRTRSPTPRRPRSSRTWCASTAPSGRSCATPSRASTRSGSRTGRSTTRRRGRRRRRPARARLDATSTSRRSSTGEAAAIGNVILADAGAQALLEHAGGARIYTSRPGEGHGRAQHEARRARSPASSASSRSARTSRARPTSSPRSRSTRTTATGRRTCA